MENDGEQKAYASVSIVNKGLRRRTAAYCGFVFHHDAIRGLRSAPLDLDGRVFRFQRAHEVVEAVHPVHQVNGAAPVPHVRPSGFPVYRKRAMNTAPTSVISARIVYVKRRTGLAMRYVIVDTVALAVQDRIGAVFTG